MPMTKEQFESWKSHFDEDLQVGYGIDIADAGLSDDDLQRWTDLSASEAVEKFAEKRDLTPKSAWSF